MTDLTKITTPFGLLDEETQEALKAHGGPYEIWYAHHGWSGASPTWATACIYRVKPEPQKASVLGWAVLDCNRRLIDFYASERDARKYQSVYSKATVTPVIGWPEGAPLPTLPEDEE